MNLGVDFETAISAVSTYTGSARRFQLIGQAGGVTVVDDYAHNPGKVHSLVTGAANSGWGRVVVLFQPHRYTRTQDQGVEQGEALVDADVLAVTEVYAAGQEPIEGVDGLIVLDAAVAKRPDLEHFWMPTLDDLLEWATDNLKSGDLCLTVGAGDISTLGPKILKALKRRP